MNYEQFQQRTWCDDEAFQLFVDLFAAHRERVESMTGAEYREYKRRQSEAYANA